MFGSYARGEATEDSDVDIVIDSRGELRGFDFFGVMGRSEDALGKYIDMYDVSELMEHSPVLEGMSHEGVVLYER